MSWIEGIPAAVKLGAAGIIAVGTIIGGYVSLDVWADDKINREVSLLEAKQDLIHDVQFQRNREQYSESQLKITELELQALEEEVAYKLAHKISITPREYRQIERLREQATFYESEKRDAQKNLSIIQTMKK